ncbi:glycosyltransferase family 2 protein [Saccharobesus litoralis]|uniref:Glycosyltransferase family 2 protein n=1 Tax=Saccharobesus litoralis TaxID=2172099 RepID=A0A2S0VVN5_9ALTE|nr:glycosyltransferase family 2 protein [Saccharobesus litoralis]AWB68255.1 glycosyltransferase family 2 protein [Saccharobesus litoralis]
MKRRPLSCFLIVRDEADRIEDCIKELAGWVDQLIILDSGSTDGTVEICQKYTDEVHQTDWPGYGPQRNRALKLCKHEWVLNLDADEKVTPELRDEIDALLSQEKLDVNFVKIPWHTYLFGKPMRRGRYSTPQGKLFLNHEGVHFKHSQVHEALQIPDVKPLVLKSPLLHFSWRTYQHMQEKHLKYACILAEEKQQKGKKGSLGFAVMRFFTDFIQQYILRGGFLDGKRGFFMALVLAQYAFHKYAALAALQMEQACQQDNEK